MPPDLQRQLMGIFCSERNSFVPTWVSAAKGIISQVKGGTSPLRWLPPGWQARRTEEQPGDAICHFPNPHVPWGGGRNSSTHRHTEEERGEKKNKKKKRKKDVNNLRDKASAVKPNLFQAPTAGFGHLD